MPESPVPPSVAAFLPADLPSPLKALAGIAVTMVHDVKHLPERAVQLPGSVLTHLAAKSLKAQQQYAEWVARGEEFLGSMQEPSEEIPPWATFDEDLPAPEPADENDTTATLGLGPGSAFDLQADDDLPVARRRPRAPATSASPSDDASNGLPPASEHATSKPAPAKKAPAKKAAAKKAAPAKRPAASTTPQKAAPVKKSAPARKAAPAGASTIIEPVGSPSTEDAGALATPQSLPDFDTLTIPQLRTRLKTLRSPELNELIAYEQAGRNRSAVVGMLRARLETLQK